MTNVLNGTVASGETPTTAAPWCASRIHTRGRRALEVTESSVIADGFPERTDPAALVVGPTGVDLGNEGTLYVADTQRQPHRRDPRRAAPLHAAGQRRGTRSPRAAT